MKLVSVIIPVYNVEPFIEAMLKSVLSQTYQHLEILIVDDESSDNSIERCLQFKDYRIRYICQKKRGLIGARNRGIHQAQGDYLAFLGSCDLWRPEKLEQHVDHLARSPDVGLSFSQSECLDYHGNSLGIHPSPKFKDISIHDFLEQNPVGKVSTAVIRREVFEDICFFGHYDGKREIWYFDEQLKPLEDIDCWMRIMAQGNWRIEGIPVPLTQYRLDGSQSSTSLHHQLECWQMLINKRCELIPELRSERPTLPA